jgi:hypothetical protein
MVIKEVARVTRASILNNDPSKIELLNDKEIEPLGLLTNVVSAELTDVKNVTINADVLDVNFKTTGGGSSCFVDDTTSGKKVLCMGVRTDIAKASYSFMMNGAELGLDLRTLMPSERKAIKTAQIK